jgi:serine/threonine protein kinase
MAQITQVGPELWVVPTGHLRTEWRVPPRYTPQTVLGTGVYGTVIKAFDNEALKYVAIKRIAKAKLCLNDSEALRALREIAVLRRLRHPNIVALLDAFEPAVGDDGLIQALCAE